MTSAIPSYSCTSVIISSTVTDSGRPIMLKHRDTDEMDNRVEYFRGSSHSFIALVNSNSKGGEAWAGTNSAGFCIMNTASYNIKDDNVPESKMDKEGIIIFKALGICSSSEDFENFLDTLPKPWGIEANFGIIDAYGDAVYYEVNNHSWVKYDVNDKKIAPKGYRTVTNFCESGRKKDVMGYERYLTANDIFDELFSSPDPGGISHHEIFNNVSRSYRNHILGVDYVKDYDKMKSTGIFNGMSVDQDFIPRKITSASVVFEGVGLNENPLHTLMWTILGYPACSVAIPLFVGNGDHLPDYMKKSSSSDNSALCNAALKIKDKYVFPLSVSNGKRYVDLAAIIKGENGKPSLLSCCKKTENKIDGEFGNLFSKWVGGFVDDDKFYFLYDRMASDFIKHYYMNFSDFMQ